MLQRMHTNERRSQKAIAAITQTQTNQRRHDGQERGHSGIERRHQRASTVQRRDQQQPNRPLTQRCCSGCGSLLCSSQRRSWLLRVAVLCVVLLLLVSVSSVEAKKKAKKDAAATTGSASATAATGGYTAAAAASAAAGAPPKVDAASTAESAAAREQQEKAEARRTELARKRAAKRAATKAANAKAARARNKILAQKRSQKRVALSKSRAAAKTKADELLAKKRAADTPEIRRKGHRKVEWLLAATAKSSTRIINFDSLAYHTYVNEGPRPYFLMIVYTALSSSHNCPYCHMANDALVPVAQAYYSRTQNQAARLLSANSTADIPESDLPVFYANVDMARCGDIFKELKFTSAPYMLLAPPRLSTNTLKSNVFLGSLPQRYRFNLQASMAPGDFSNFIHKLTGSAERVEIGAAKPGLVDLVLMLSVLASLGFIGVRYGSSIVLSLRSWRGVKSFALMAGLALYCWCISGGMYNIIRGTQWAENRRDGSVNYINGDARDQFAAEGLIIGVLNLAAAVALVVVNTRGFESSASGAGGAAKAKPTPMQHALNALGPVLSPGVCLALAVFLWSRILGIYTQKNGHYRMGWVWR